MLETVTQVGEAHSTQNATSVDLRAHHAQCEINYHRCLALMPGLREGTESWVLALHGKKSTKVTLQVLELAPYTSTICITQSFAAAPHLHPAELRVRLYHDVEMAEVVAWDRHRHWLPRYSYPNKQMYQPDEKLALNRFLGEWLCHCRKVGVVYNLVCEIGRINPK